MSLMKALAFVCNLETRLCFAGLLQPTSSSVLFPRSTSSGVPASCPKVPSSVASGSRTSSSGGLHCGHCDRDGHVEAYNYRK